MAQRSTVLAASTAMTLAIGFGATAVPSAGAAPHADKASGGSGRVQTTPVEDKGYYDARVGTGAAKAALDRSAALASSRRATESLRSSLGRQAVVEMDGLTGTPRQVARLDGFLTGTSSRPASRIALGFVRSHLGALGLSRSDLQTLTLRRDYVDIAGTHHLSWTQSVGGVARVRQRAQGCVTGKGRLLTSAGRRSPASWPARSGWQGLVRALRDRGRLAPTSVSHTAAGPKDFAQQVVFVRRRDPQRLAGHHHVRVAADADRRGRCGRTEFSTAGT